MELLKKFNLACEEVLADMNMLYKIIDRNGNKAEDIDWSDLYKLPTEEYKYACLLKKIDEGTFEGHIQFEVPSAVRNLEVPEDRIHMVKEIVSKVTGNEEYDVKFSKILAPKTFTTLDTPVENFYAERLPWADAIDRQTEEPPEEE